MSNKDYFYNWLINRHVCVDLLFFDIFYKENEKYIKRKLTKFNGYWWKDWNILERYYKKCQNDYLQFKKY